MKVMTIIVCIGCGIILPLMCLAAPPQDQRPSTNPTLTEVQSAIAKILPLPVYGRVLDQNDHPVSGAEVEFYWEEPVLGAFWRSKERIESIKTDASGSFRYTIGKSVRAGIQKIGCPGYEFIRGMSPYFAPNVDDQKMISSTSKDNLLLFYLRKKGETTYLLKRETMRLDMKLGGDVARFADILPGPDQTELDMRAAGKMQGNRQIGFGAEVAYSTNDIAYRLTFVAPEGGAVLLSDKILYEAPEQGYQSNATVAISTKGNEKRLFLVKKPMWLFIKTAEPTVYARLDVDFDAVTPSIRFKTAINPYGERNFEEETELDYKGRKQLETDARINLRQNKRPSKPDLPKLVKEAKEKAEKDKGKP